MKHILEFLNPVWHYGENVTVRLGTKWAEKAKEDDRVSIRRTGLDEELADGRIDQIIYKPFPNVTIADLYAEHDPECRTPDGLVKAMLRAYPDFKLNSSVTVIRFIL